MFKIKAKAEDLQENNGESKYLNKSGVYPVTINRASINVNKNGTESIVFNVTYNGNEQVIYGPNYESKNGPIEFGIKIYSALGVIVGLKDGQEPTVEQEDCVIGKDNKEVTLDCIQEFADVDVIMHLQQEFTNYQGKGIYESLVLRGFFNEDGASAQEILSGEDSGKRLALVEEKYANNISYKDGVTAEDVATWVANGRGKGTSAPTAKKAASKTKSLFGKK